MDAEPVDYVLGLGANLFYNSPMEACVVICRPDKSSKPRGRVIFIDAVGEIVRERSASFLKAEHQKCIVNTYRDFKELEGFAPVVSTEQNRVNHSDPGIPLYMRTKEANIQYEVASVRAAIEE